MENNNQLKEELHLHTLAMEEQQKTRARLLGESDYFNRIVEMNAEAERRRIAAMAMQSLILDPRISRERPYSCIASEAVEAADALIVELNKKNDGK